MELNLGRALRTVAVLIGLTVSVMAAGGPSSDLQPELRRLLVGDLRFSSADLGDLERGKVIRRVLDPTSSGELAVAGGVRIHGNKASLLAAYRDIVRFKRNANVLEIGRFGNPPQLSGLEGLTITHDDFDLRECRVGNCDIRLPADCIRRFTNEVDWRRPDAAAHAASLFKQMLLDNVRAYSGGGPGRITEYDDELEPVRPVEDFHAVLKSSPYIEAALPGLAAHLTTYPVDPMPGAEDFLYWSKEKFGIAPFISVTHVTL